MSGELEWDRFLVIFAKIYSMKKLLIRLVPIVLVSPIFGQPINISASFDTTIDFWGAAVNTDWSAQTQAYTASPYQAGQAGDAAFHSAFDYAGMIIKFDLSTVTPAIVNAPGFNAMLDVMFQGFAEDSPGNRNTQVGGDPVPAGAGAGDGLTFIDAYRLLESFENSANRWLKDSTTPTLMNWDGTVPTSLAQARAAGSNFVDSGEVGATAESTATFTHGWGDSLPGATSPNTYGELTWDVTGLVMDWVNGVLPNNGIFLVGNQDLSWGEQVNLLTSETADRPDDGISSPGDAAPMLRLTVVPEPSALTLLLGLVSLGFIAARRRRSGSA